MTFSSMPWRERLCSHALFEPCQASLDVTQPFGTGCTLLDRNSDEPIKPIRHATKAFVDHPLQTAQPLAVIGQNIRRPPRSSLEIGDVPGHHRDTRFEPSQARHQVA